MSVRSKLCIFFGILVMLGVLSVEIKHEFYPSIQFPIFPNLREGIDLSLSSMRLVDEHSYTEVNFAELIKPYDKRFLLFGARALEQRTPSVLEKFQEIYQARGRQNGTLFVELKDTTIIFR